VADAAASGDGPTAPSKAEQRKARRAAARDAARLVRKDRRVAKREEKRERIKEERERRDGDNGGGDKTEERQPKRKRGKRPLPPTLPMAIVIDAAFDSLMTDTEVVSLSGQIARSYTTARLGTAGEYRDGQHVARAVAPAAPSDRGGRPLLLVSGVDGRLRAHMDGADRGQYLLWRDVRVLPGSSLEGAVAEARAWMADVAAGPPSQRAAWPLPVDGASEPAGEEGDVTTGAAEPPSAKGAAKQEREEAEEEDRGPAHASTVYLTAESPHLLTRLRPHTTYIVGGLVDRNRHKGACHARARALGLATARLPVAEHVAMPRHSKVVLATSHVVALLVRWLARGGDWERALLDVVPARTGVVGRSTLGEGREEVAEGGGETSDSST
jgi:tRNA (guanine9-N1)-methyltransferase